MMNFSIHSPDNFQWYYLVASLLRKAGKDQTRLRVQSNQSILENNRSYKYLRLSLYRMASSLQANRESYMSNQIKILLIAAGSLLVCGICGATAYAVSLYYPFQTQTAAAIATPSEVVVATTIPTLVPPPTPLPEKLPFHSVVQITAQYDQDGEVVDEWSGSGTIISTDGLILTNAHVVLPDRDYPVDHLMISLTASQDEKPEPSYYAEVLQADAALDLAVIKITKDINGNDLGATEVNLPAVPIGDSDALNLGDRISIMGYPGIGGETITLTSGEVSGFTSEEAYGNRAFIKTNATIAGGNSGGLAVNENGELVGIPTQLGYGGEKEFVDCRVLADTNGDGTIDNRDTCIPTGGFINSLRPVKLALPFIERAKNGEVAIANDFVETPKEAPSGGGTLFEDDFSSENTGWEVFSDKDGSAGYNNGAYKIDIASTNMVRWGVSKADFVDTISEITATVDKPTGEGDFGVICRYTDEENFYALEISEDGYAAIWKLKKGAVETLVDWQYFGEPTGDTSNITASCIGDELSIALDGVEVASAVDPDFQSGAIGLIAGTNNVENLSVSFDDLVIKSPR
jgi:S1-C subfamily serine protease